MRFSEQRRGLLSSEARIQAPWVKVTIGSYTFGVYSRQTSNSIKDKYGTYIPYKVQYPDYVQSLQIVKINVSYH